MVSWKLGHWSAHVSLKISAIKTDQHLLPLRLEGEESLNTVMSVGPSSEKFNIVSNDHGRTQKCDFCVSVCKTIFTDHHILDTIRGFRDSVLVCKMKDCYITISTNFAYFNSFPSSDASDCMVRLYENKPLQNAFKRIQHYIYLLKLYSISIILLLKNNLTNICSKISKIRMNLWLVCTWNMKSSGKYERWEKGECTLHRWPK